MKPTKLFLALVVVLLLGACATKEAQNNRVWNEVAMGYNNSNDVIKVTGVKMLDEHTELAMHITYPAGYWVKMASNIIYHGLERAAEKLRSTELPIADVCTQVGMPDAQYFSRVFKSYFGMPPSAYREQQD